MRWAIFGLLLATWGAACTTFSSDPGDAPADAGAGAAADGSSVPPPPPDGGRSGDAASALPVTYDPAFRCAGRRLFDGLLVCNDFEAATEVEAFIGLSDKETNNGAVSHQPGPPQGIARAAVPSVSGRAYFLAVAQRDQRAFRFGVDLRRGQGLAEFSPVIELGPAEAPFFTLTFSTTQLEVGLGQSRIQGLDGEWHRFTVTFSEGKLWAAVDGADFGIERTGELPTSFEIRVGFAKGAKVSAPEATLDIDNLVFKVD